MNSPNLSSRSRQLKIKNSPNFSSRSKQFKITNVRHLALPLQHKQPIEYLQCLSRAINRTTCPFDIRNRTRIYINTFNAKRGPWTRSRDNLTSVAETTVSSATPISKFGNRHEYHLRHSLISSQHMHLRSNLILSSYFLLIYQNHFQ